MKRAQHTENDQITKEEQPMNQTLIVTESASDVPAELEAR